MCWLLNWLLGNNVKMTEVVFVSQSVQPNGGDRHELSRSVYEHVRINWDKCSKEKEYGPWELVTKESDTWRRWLLTVSRREGIKRRDQVHQKKGSGGRAFEVEGTLLKQKGVWCIQGMKENLCGRSSGCQRVEWCLRRQKTRAWVTFQGTEGRGRF